MTPADFDNLLNARIEKMRSVLASKAVEYAPAGDRLHNFKRGAAMTGRTPAQVCVGFLVKHLVSVLDIVEAAAQGNAIRIEMTDEKIGDAINYLVLLEAILSRQGTFK